MLRNLKLSMKNHQKMRIHYYENTLLVLEHDGQTIEVTLDEATYQERSGEQMIWYGNNILMKLQNGETGIVGTTTEVSEEPVLIQQQLERRAVC